MLKYIVGSLLGAFSMLGLSYLWHGVLLNDFERLPLPFPLFFSLLGLLYWVLSLGIVFLFSYFNKHFSSVFLRFATGAVIGFFLYLAAFTLNVSIAHHQMKHLVIDFIWQMTEQGLGSVMVGIVVTFSIRAQSFNAH